MIENRNVTIVTDPDGRKIVFINDIKFKGKRKINWDEVEQFLKGYVGDCYEVIENAERIYIGNELPDEFAGSISKAALKGARAKAKANSATAIPELIQIATNPKWEENKKEKHEKSAKQGWYRYEIRFALPIYVEEKLSHYNIYYGLLLVNHAKNGKKYLYDIIGIKKEASLKK